MQFHSTGLTPAVAQGTAMRAAPEPLHHVAFYSLAPCPCNILREISDCIVEVSTMPRLTDLTSGHHE